MNIVYIAAGGLIIAIVLVGLMAMMARYSTWAATLKVWGFSVAVTAVICAGAMLIGYGIEGHL